MPEKLKRVHWRGRKPLQKKKKFWNLQVLLCVVWTQLHEDCHHDCCSWQSHFYSWYSLPSWWKTFADGHKKALSHMTKNLSLPMCPQAVFTGLKKWKEFWASRTWWDIILLFYRHLFFWLNHCSYIFLCANVICSFGTMAGFFSFSNWFLICLSWISLSVFHIPLT